MMINISIYLGSSIKAFGSFLNYLFLALPSNLVNARDNYNSRCEQVNNTLDCGNSEVDMRLYVVLRDSHASTFLRLPVRQCLI
jgi:hypothetical protein